MPRSCVSYAVLARKPLGGSVLAYLYARCHQVGSVRVFLACETRQRTDSWAERKSNNWSACAAPRSTPRCAPVTSRHRFSLARSVFDGALRKLRRGCRHGRGHMATVSARCQSVNVKPLREGTRPMRSSERADARIGLTVRNSAQCRCPPRAPSTFRRCRGLCSPSRPPTS